MDVCVGGFALCHLDGRDAQGPDVGHTVVADLLDDLRGHPEWSADHGVSLCHGILEELRGTAVVQVSNTQNVAVKKSNNGIRVTVSCPATPKSASFACPSVLSRMFPALMSRWIFLMKCRYSSPFRVDFRMVAISSSVSWCQQKKWNVNENKKCSCVITVSFIRFLINFQVMFSNAQHLTNAQASY